MGPCWAGHGQGAWAEAAPSLQQGETSRDKAPVPAKSFHGEYLCYFGQCSVINLSATGRMVAGAAGGEGAGIPGAAELWISSSEACGYIMCLPGGSLRHRGATRHGRHTDTCLKTAMGNGEIFCRNPSFLPAPNPFL